MSDSETVETKATFEPIDSYKRANNVAQTPNKGDIIINPLTQRPVRVGGKTWRKLVKEGITSGHYKDPEELDTYSKTEDSQSIQQKIKEANNKLPTGHQAVRGRGKYKNKIVSRKVQPPISEIGRFTAKKASKIIEENLDRLSKLDGVELEKQLEELILSELASPEPPKEKRGVGRPRKNLKQTKYKIIEPEVEESDSDGDNGDTEDSDGDTEVEEDSQSDESDESDFDWGDEEYS